MKVGLVIRSFDASLGGAEHWTWQFAASLAAAGHEIHAVASRFGSGTEEIGVARHVVPDVRSTLDWAAAAEQVLKTLRLDVIHDMGHGWHCDVFQPHGGSRMASFEQNLLLLPRWLQGAKRRFAQRTPRYRAFNRLLARQYRPDGRRVIALSKMVAGHMARYHSISEKDLRLVYNGVDIERFSPEICDRHRAGVRRQLGLVDETLLLIVAHNFRLKGVPTLLRAVAKLRRAGRAVHLAVVGGKHLGRYRRLARRLGAEKSVTFLGPRNDVIRYYGAADVYVHPTFYDPCSLVVLEALACGLPVITSRFNGAGELMREGVEGFVLQDPSDDGELALRIRLLLDPGERRTMSAAARKLAEAHPFERNLRELTAVYEESAAQPRRAA